MARRPVERPRLGIAPLLRERRILDRGAPEARRRGLGRALTQLALGKMVRREATQRQLSRAGLTPRELEIARLAGQGLRNVGIGTMLGISPATVKIHLHQIYRKLALSGRIALMVYARDNDLV